MKVVLLENIDKLGKVGEVKTVADGFALNYLLPKKMAEAATEQKIKEAKNKENKKLKELEQKSSEQEKFLAKLPGLKLEIKVKASEAGKLFAGLSAEDIMRELKTQKNIAVAAKFIRLEKHIKTTGEHEVEIFLGKDKRQNITIMVNGL